MYSLIVQYFLPNSAHLPQSVVYAYVLLVCAEVTFFSQRAGLSTIEL